MFLLRFDSIFSHNKKEQPFGERKNTGFLKFQHFIFYQRYIFYHERAMFF